MYSGAGVVNKKNVIILTPFYNGTGGAETFMNELWRMAYERHYASVVTIDWQGTWKGINWLHGGYVVFHLFFKAWQAFRYKRIDTVHALGFNAGFVGALLKTFYKYKLIVSPLALYDFDNKLLRHLAKWTLKRADLVFAESETSRMNLSIVCDVKKIKTFTHWADKNMFYPYPINLKNERLQVLFVGRPIKGKGMHIIKEVEKQMEGVDFTYVEGIPHSEIAMYYQMADVLVVPSLYAESPNIVVAEASLCGCVVVTSDQGALPEQVAGFGVSVIPTVENFKRVISRLDRKRKKLQRMRKDTITYAREHFTDKNADKIIGEY